MRVHTTLDSTLGRESAPPQVHETAQEPIPDEKGNMNGVVNLSHEATVINQNFSQQVLQQGALPAHPAMCAPKRRGEI
eukprot:9472262-Pyramimonas_sp.AAC.1